MRKLLLIFTLISISSAAGAANLVFSAGGKLNTTSFDPAFYSAPANGTPWSVLVSTNMLVPDQDPDPNVGSYWVLEGTMTIGDDSFDVINFPFSLRSFDIFNADGLISHKDRATLELGANVARPVPLAIGPNVIANFFIAMESADDQLFDDTTLGGLIGLTLDDLCFSGAPVCSAVIGSRFGLQMYQPGVTGIFEIRGEIEYLSITNVPVLPAFWLFGSALGLLGWLRRKST